MRPDDQVEGRFGLSHPIPDSPELFLRELQFVHHEGARVWRPDIPDLPQQRFWVSHHDGQPKWLPNLARVSLQELDKNGPILPPIMTLQAPFGPSL